MTARKRIDWPPHVREALHADVRLSYEAAQDADTRFKIRVYLAVEQGLTTAEVAEGLGVSQSVVSKYRMQGEAAYRERLAAE
ncbi:hypothetical protein [Streptomyces sp. ALI-76-A]|uniref:hypothetical protein n=1 Tax=Streptomyces sp. ALI-76-A TaxID=3025736 RepID=UPI00256F62DB|nr:hypothetical protein [Streptomyces sp. ALI-76-A]MDL5205109.1 hypothetical protein [Streptomyces sp. ALI-76-A]